MSLKIGLQSAQQADTAFAERDFIKARVLYFGARNALVTVFQQQTNPARKKQLLSLVYKCNTRSTSIARHYAAFLDGGSDRATAATARDLLPSVLRFDRRLASLAAAPDRVGGDVLVRQVRAALSNLLQQTLAADDSAGMMAPDSARRNSAGRASTRAASTPPATAAAAAAPARRSPEPRQRSPPAAAPGRAVQAERDAVSPQLRAAVSSFVQRQVHGTDAAPAAASSPPPARSLTLATPLTVEAAAAHATAAAAAEAATEAEAERATLRSGLSAAHALKAALKVKLAASEREARASVEQSRKLAEEARALAEVQRTLLAEKETSADTLRVLAQELDILRAHAEEGPSRSELASLMDELATARSARGELAAQLERERTRVGVVMRERDAALERAGSAEAALTKAQREFARTEEARDLKAREATRNAARAHERALAAASKRAASETARARADGKEKVSATVGSLERELKAATRQKVKVEAELAESKSALALQLRAVASLESNLREAWRDAGAASAPSPDASRLAARLAATEEKLRAADASNAAMKAAAAGKKPRWKSLEAVDGEAMPSNLQMQAELVLLQEQLLQLGEASEAERLELTKKIENLQYSLQGRDDFFAGGWLTKRGTGGLHKWQRRWFVLQGTTLVYSQLVEKGRIRFGPKSMVVMMRPNAKRAPSPPAVEEHAAGSKKSRRTSRGRKVKYPHRLEISGVISRKGKKCKLHLSSMNREEQTMWFAVLKSAIASKTRGGTHLRPEDVARLDHECYIPADDIELTERLGGGGAGSVHKGLWLKKYPVAVKQLYSLQANRKDDIALDEFRAEALTLSQLRHPNIVRFFGVCFTTRAALLITELCSRSLADVILASPDGVSRPEFFRMMDEAAQGLSYLHQRNMVHLDVKPANVLLDSSGTVKLCDFGLTQLRRQQQSGDGEGGGGEGEEEVLVQGGTLPYMSPELLQLSVYSDSVPEESQTIDAKVDARGLDLGKSDTFAFGVMMWELWSSKELYRDVRDLSQLPRMVCEGARPSIDAIADLKLRALVEQCWHTDSTQRPTLSALCTTLPRLGERYDSDQDDDTTAVGEEEEEEEEEEADGEGDAPRTMDRDPYDE